MNKVFTDPNEWRMELWRQHITGVVKTIKDDVGITKENHGVFILDLKDEAGSALASLLLKNKKLDGNILIIAVELKTFVKWISILSDMNGFKIRKPIILYEDGFNCCVVAANGAEVLLLRE